MNYVKIYQFPQNTPANNIIGVVNAKLLENINWYIRPSSAGSGDQEYQIHGMYYGSSADVDFSLNILIILFVLTIFTFVIFIWGDSLGIKAAILLISMYIFFILFLLFNYV